MDVTFCFVADRSRRRRLHHGFDLMARWNPVFPDHSRPARRATAPRRGCAPALT